MSNTPFVESSSSDPVERAIARKVQRILNDKTLDRQRRETLVRKAQRELIEHRKRQLQQQTLTQQVAALKLPQGFRPQSITVKESRVHVGVLNRQQAFVWLDAGSAPQGIAANQSSFALRREGGGNGRSVRKNLEQAIAERRNALGYGKPDPAKG